MAMVRRMGALRRWSMIPRNLGLLVGALFLWSFGEGLFFIFQPIYLESFGATPFQIGAILGISSLALVLVHLPAGFIADRFGRKPVMLAGWWLGAVTALAMFLAHNLYIFSIALVLYYATAFVGSANNSYITASRGRLSMARAITLASAAYGAGSIFSPAIGGWMAEHWGMRSMIGVACLLYVASCLVMLQLEPQPATHASADHDYRSLLSNRPFCTLALLAFGACFAMFLGMALVPNFLQDERGVSMEQIGLLGSAAAIGTVAINAIVGRWKPQQGFLLSQTMVLGQAVFLWFGNSMGWFVIAFLLRGGFSGARSAVVAQAGQVVMDREMGVAYAAIETMVAGALVVAPLCAGVFYQWRADLPIAVSALLIIVMLILSVRHALHAPAREQLVLRPLEE
jgi:MFS transporter, DHA1 family, tetracycline resistance protein